MQYTFFFLFWKKQKVLRFIEKGNYTLSRTFWLNVIEAYDQAHVCGCI